MPARVPPRPDQLTPPDRRKDQTPRSHGVDLHETASGSTLAALLAAGDQDFSPVAAKESNADDLGNSVTGAQPLALEKSWWRVRLRSENVVHRGGHLLGG